MFRDVSPGARGMFEMAAAPVNAFMEGQQNARRNTLAGLQAQKMQNDLNDDAEWDRAFAAKDVDTMMKIDPNTTQSILQHWQQQAMTGLEPIPVPQKIDMAPLIKREDEQWKQVREQRNEDRKYNLDVAREGRMSAQAADGGDGSKPPAGYRWKPDGSLEAIPGGPATKDVASPLPVGALRLVDDATQALAATGESGAIVGRAIKKLESGKVKLGLVDNTVSRTRNATGMSSDNSRAYADLRQTLEKLRNNYLLLAKGVQTEGDAQRAWNSEIGESAENDNTLALQQLRKASAMLKRAEAAQKARIATIRTNYGNTPAQDQPAAPSTGPKPGDVVRGYRFKGGNPANKNNWEQQ